MGSNVAELLRERGDDEATNSQTLSEESLKNGRRWTFRETFDLGTSDADIVIANDLSADDLRVVSVTIRTDDLVTGSETVNPTIDANGTDLSVRNDRIDGDADAPPDGAVVEEGGTYSGGGASLPLRTAGGVGSGAKRTAINNIPSATVRIGPGGGIRYQISDDSGNQNTLIFEAILSRSPPADEL